MSIAQIITRLNEVLYLIEKESILPFPSHIKLSDLSREATKLAGQLKKLLC
jgi:hypothetical protein